MLGPGGVRVSHPSDDLRQALAGRYRVERELGHGGSATVYLAQDLKYRRAVALKVLSRELTLAVRTERFRREIDIAARLDHPHILPLFEADSADGFLFYTMPAVEGESLRARLGREGPLPIEDAVEITGQVADALDYAHGRGVIHRDIKPENILLSGRHARVADFGIARAIARDSGASVTETGNPVGTVAYMSPEQINGATDLDGRTDIYGLGCVLFEMLAGAPPYLGPTLESVVAKHLTEAAPDVRVQRPDVPEALAEIVARALANRRDDRFTSAAELKDALARGRLTPQAWWIAPRVVAVSLGLSLAAAAFWAARQDWFPLKLAAASASSPAAPDTFRYVILPFEHSDSGQLFIEDQMLRDALTRWSGIAIVDRFQVRDALARLGARPLTSDGVRSVALQLRAGRYIRGEVSPIGDSIRVHASVYDALRDGALLTEGAVKLAPDLNKADSAIATLADRLLFGNPPSTDHGDVETGTSSFPARQAYARGRAAVEEWNLPAADSAFVAATRHDPNYAQAHLWLAQVRFWGDTVTATWRSSAERAAAGRIQLSPRDQMLSDAVTAFSRGEIERACNTWSQLTRREPYYFPAWYGLANCLTRDNVVARDPASPSGWRFRSSYHQAIRSYQRAFSLLPAIHESFRAGAYESVRRLLVTREDDVRVGRAPPPDTSSFGAKPSWEGDSLVYVPFPLREVREGRSWTLPARRSTAVRRQRELFHEIATSWVAAFPKSAGAMEALAVSLEMLGEPSAIDTLRRARAFAVDANERLRLASFEFWMQLKFSIPSDFAGLRSAVKLADSLFHSRRPTPLAAPRLLASLAAVTGHVYLAADLSQRPGAYSGVPGPIARSAPTLLAFAALGQPSDSLRALEQQVESAIENVVDPGSRASARLEWLARAATLAFPDVRLRSISRLAGSGDYLVDAEAAFLRGDTATVRRILGDLRVVRRRYAPSDLMLDALYPEAWLIAAMGDDRAAINWLDPTLNSLTAIAPQTLADPARAGALVRAMALRAELADHIRDSGTAASWARAVAILWSDADDVLQPTVRRMERLAR